MDIIQKRFDILKEIFDQISLEINKKNSYTIYYLFIFWILTAIALLVIQDIVDLGKEKRRVFRSGIIQKMVQRVYNIARGAIVWTVQKIANR